MSEPQARAKQIVNDLRLGVSSETLMEKYHISERVLHLLLHRLAASGLISQSELYDWLSRTPILSHWPEPSTERQVFTCRKCGCELPDDRTWCPTCEEFERIVEGTWILDAADVTLNLRSPSLLQTDDEAVSERPDALLPCPTAEWVAEIPSPDVVSPLTPDDGLLVKCLLYGAYRGEAKLINYALARGTEIDCRGKHGHTALMRAAHKGHAEAVELLTEGKANIEATDPLGNTALILAAAECQGEIVKRLLEAGANPNARNVEENSPLLFAAGISAINIAELLLKHGADVNAANSNGITPLMRASKKGFFDMVALLLSHSAKVDAVNRYGDTALMSASFGGHANLVQLLLRAGARVTPRNVFGNTALMKAAFKGRNLVVLLLLGAGADPTVEDNTGRNSAKLAASGKHEETARLIESLSGAYTVTLSKPT